MNVIRFYLNYQTFESDEQPYVYKQAGWDWLEDNIRWAKKHGIYLILNMHVPQGGFQSQCKGEALWEDTRNQDRLVALWKEIAQRYQNQPQIAGYDLLNEPTPKNSIEEWSILAQRLIDNVRLVDQNHLIIAEKALALGCDYTYRDANDNYPQITERNLMYTVHMYQPWEYTHQLQDWANPNDGGKYPDEQVITLPSDTKYATGDYNNPRINSTNSEWTKLTGTPYKVTDPDLIVGRVVGLTSNLETGIVYFDGLEVIEWDAQGQLVDTLFKADLKRGTFYYWSSEGDGSYVESSDGRMDDFALTLTGSAKSSSVTMADYTFEVELGHSYQVNGWVKAENFPLNASATMSAEFYVSESGKKVAHRDYDFLSNAIKEEAQYIENQGFPVYFGEFGVVRAAFENNKGGENWVRDAIKAYDSLGYHFTYHAYKESAFGYFDGWNLPVDTTTVNQKLKAVFETYFDGNVLGLTPVPSELSPMISIYPNPTQSLLVVSGVENVDQIELYSIEGELVKSVLQSREINTTEMTDGVYVLKVYFQGGFSTHQVVLK